MDPVETFEHDGVTVSIYQDDDARNPYVDWDQASRLLVSPALARQYDFGADVCHELGERDGAVVARWLTLCEGYAVVIPFYFADYGSGGARVYETDADGCSGFVVVDRETLAREWDTLEQAEACARAELETFAQYVEGDVYGIIVAEGTPEEESVWGFYGYEYAKQEAREMAEAAGPDKRLREWRERHYALNPTPGPMPIA